MRAKMKAKRATSRAAREPLSRERIETAALALIEQGGLDDFSTRRLAAVLGCEAMSIYHYFPSKQHLMDALVDRVLGTVKFPSPELEPIARLRELAVNYRRTALQHPNFQRYLAFHRLNTAAGVKFIDGVLKVVAALGGDTEATARLFRAVGYYLTGATLDETAGYASGYSAAVPVAEEQVIRDHPAVVAVNPYFKKDQHEKTFLLGLDVLLAGAREFAGGARRRAVRERPAGRRSPALRSSSR